jgi:DNA-binding response OmpR family regulator
MSAKILVIDDESVTRRLVTHALKKVDVETVGAADAAEALRLAEAHDFALALVDINLPDMDGFTLIKHLKAIPHMNQVPMLVFTARNNADDRMLATESGAIGFFYKPFSTQELRDLVTAHL